MDDLILTGAAGTALNVGSWLRADPGPDFDEEALVRPEWSEHPFREGGALAFTQSGVRRFRFPLLLRSGASLTLTGVESTLRALAQPGAYVDLGLGGVATGDRVRFDVRAGRLRPEYHVRHNEAGVRLASLELDVDPFGYLPTMILLASAASVGLPGRLAVPGGSVIGDAPGWARVVIAPTTGTSYPAGTWLTDMVAWSLGGRPSFVGYWPAASVASAMTATLAGDAFAPASQALRFYPNPSLSVYTQLGRLEIPAGLEPAYRGRFRLTAFAQLTPSQPYPWMLTADVAPALNAGALASAGPVATLPPACGGVQEESWSASPGYVILDLGEVTVPPVASGVPQPVQIRVWAKSAALATVGNATTPIIGIAGLHLLPAGPDHGHLPRGLAQPTQLTPSVGRLELAAAPPGRALIAAPTGPLATSVPVADALTHYRGAFPAVTASTVQLDLLAGSRKQAIGATARVLHTAPAFAAVSVEYRPRFAFLKPQL